MSSRKSNLSNYTLRYNYTCIRISGAQNADTKCWLGCGTQGLSFIAGGYQNGPATLEDCLTISSKLSMLLPYYPSLYYFMFTPKR